MKRTTSIDIPDHVSYNQVIYSIAYDVLYRTVFVQSFRTIVVEFSETSWTQRRWRTMMVNGSFSPSKLRWNSSNHDWIHLTEYPPSPYWIAVFLNHWNDHLREVSKSSSRCSVTHHSFEGRYHVGNDEGIGGKSWLLDICMYNVYIHKWKRSWSGLEAQMLFSWFKLDVQLLHSKDRFVALTVLRFKQRLQQL